MEENSNTLRSYDDIWPVVIRQDVSDYVIFGTPFVTMTDENTLLNQLRPQMEFFKKYSTVSSAKGLFLVPLLTQDRRKVIVSEVIHCPARKWSSKENHDNFMLSMVLRAYFQRSDTFGWDDKKVKQWFKGGQK